MAQHTPNFNLYQPEATDPIEDFRAEFNTNMGIIDNNLGGGGGGDSVSWNQIQASGTKIAEITINGTSQNVYAPSGGGGGGSHNYSTTEQTIGTWINGSTIYEYVYDLGSDLSIPNNSWTYAVTIPNIDKIIDCRGQYSGGSFYPLMAYHSGNDVNVLAARLNAPASARYLIMQYTKTV